MEMETSFCIEKMKDAASQLIFSDQFSNMVTPENPFKRTVTTKCLIKKA